MTSRGEGGPSVAATNFLPMHLALRLRWLVLWLGVSSALLSAAEKAEPVKHRLIRDLPYYEGEALARATDEQKARCRLDLSCPEKSPGFATVIWFHGGGLTAGQRAFPALKADRYALVAAGYRLAPAAQCPDYIADAAAAVAWVLRHIAREGGDPTRVFVSGHSAGAYLAAMVGMDPRWLAPYGFSPKNLAGIIPVSGQMTSHFLVRRQRGDTGLQYRPLIDEFAPLYHCAPDLPPICLIVGDPAIEWKARVEENAFLAASLRAVGHPRVEFYQLGGLDHGAVGEAAMPVARAFIKRISLAQGFKD